jgi:inhibitor of cysteine peptidase
MTHSTDTLPQPTDPAQPVRVAPGASFTIVLEANHTTGYSWQLAPLARPPAVEYVGTSYQEQPHEAGMTGVGGWEVWTFRALRRHRATLTFHYRRPWEAAEPPAQITRFTVLIQPAAPAPTGA